MQSTTNIFAAAVLLVTSIAATAADSVWKEYSVAESGFTVALPSAPQTRLLPLASRIGSTKVYESIEVASLPSKFSIFVGMPDSQGIYEPESMDAFLSSHIKAMVSAAENGKLLSSRRTTFRGRPALEYEFSHQLEGHPYIARGVTLMVDGGHMRISMWHPASAQKAEVTFKRFVESFKLTPISYVAADKQFADPRGIAFSPPMGWVQQPVQSQVQVARFANLTRSMQLLVAGTPAYTCDSLQGELQASGRLKTISTVRLNDHPFKKLITFEDVPKYNVRLTTVQYCINSHVGAVVLGATEEEAMFTRWERVFEGTAASVRVR